MKLFFWLLSHNNEYSQAQRIFAYKQILKIENKKVRLKIEELFHTFREK